MRINKKIILIIVVLIVVLAALTIVARGSSNVTIRLAPTVATMTLDGSKHISPGKHQLTPGKHTIVATMNGFATTTKDFTVPTTGNLTVDVLLDPNSQVGRDYLARNPHEQLLREQLGSAIFKATGKQVASQNPLIKLLPYIAPDGTYRIDYGSGTTTGDSLLQTIFITASSDNAKLAATSWIQGKGYAISKLKIITTIEPMLACVPYQTTDYSLDPKFASGEGNQPIFQLNATLQLSHADESNQDTAIAQYKQEVGDYIRSCGADPANYTVTYSVQSA